MKYFTPAQIEEIRKQMATLGIRDTDLPDASELTGDEIVAIVQDNVNKKVGIKALFQEFLPEDFVSQLVQGKSAYEIAVENGFSGTEAEWLASLKGADGANGRTGNTGATGPQGPQGPAGVTSVNATVDANVGTPSVDVSMSGTQLNLAFHNLKGADGTGGGGGTTYTAGDGIDITNNVISETVATSGKLGGIKIGYTGTGSKTYPVKLDSNNKAYVYVPWTDTAISAATSSKLGGIKIGFTDNNTSNKNYPVQLDGNNKAYVHVPWEAGTGGSGDGGGAGYWEQAFAAYDENDVPSVEDIPDLIVDDYEPEGSGSGSGSGDEYYGVWRHYAPNNIYGDLVIWMAVRWVDSNGTPEDWQGPWRISGAGGENGLDGDTIEYIYTRTNSENTDLVPSLTNATPDASSTGQTPADDDFVPQGWKDNAMDSSIKIDSTHRVMWMAFRIKVHTNAHPEGQWSDFVGPIAWSIYGRQGIDGDGLEYIFYAGLTAPTENPHTWNKSTTGANGTWEQREFIKDGYDNVWFDDPVDLDAVDSQTSSPVYPAGTKQWVCTRRRYADNAANRSTYTSSTDTSEPYWHAFTEPALWSYKAKDGDAGTGIVADFDNDMMAVPLDSSGNVKAFTQKAKIYLYNGASSVACTASLVSIQDTDAPVKTYNNQTDFNSGSGYLVTISGDEVTITLRAGDVNLANKSLLVTIQATATINSATVQRNAVLTITGIHFGVDGGSFKLGTNARVIRHIESTITPDKIYPTCVHVDGLDTIATYNPTSASLSVLNALVTKSFCFKYEIDDSGTVYDLSSLYISTSNIQNNLRIMLYYGDNPNDTSTLVLVDQETIFVVSDGTTPYGKFKSVVFKRGASKPSKPDTGVISTGSDTADYRGISNSHYGGTFADPVPYGWYDGIPAYDSTKSDNENSLWMTTRIFIGDETTTQQTVWTDVQRAADAKDYDIEFALEQPGDVEPATPTDANRHGGSGTQIWFDPDLDKNAAIDWEMMVWRAERFVRNGVSEDWVITRIKGENGAKGDDGRGIASMTTTYGISSSASTMPTTWYNDISQVEPHAGDWIWAKTVVTYDDTPPSTDTFYTKYRQVNDGTNGSFTAVPFRGVYDNGVVYYGNSTRTDIVYHRPSGKYYRANPLAPVTGGEFTSIEPTVTTGWESYWLEFGENYDNLATGFAFIEDLVVMRLNTAGSPDAVTERILIQGNEMHAFDSTNTERLLITGDLIDLTNSSVSVPFRGDVARAHQYIKQNTSGAQTGSVSYDFLVSSFVVSSSSSVVIPDITVELDASCGGNGKYDLTVTGALYKDNQSTPLALDSPFIGVSVNNLSAETRTITIVGKTNTLGSGTYALKVKITGSYTTGTGLTDSVTLNITDMSNGSIKIYDASKNNVRIGKNGMAISLGGAFYAAFGLGGTNHDTPVIVFEGENASHNTIGIKISSAGVQINKGDGQGYVAL